jgi:hypothetical protein
MPYAFYGSWAPLILTTGVKYPERVMVSGSNGSDGPITGPLGVTLPAISGNAWQVDIEYTADGGATWSPSPSTRDVVVTPADGLLVALFSFYDTSAKLIEGYDIHFVYLNPQVNPKGSPPYGFTLPSSSFRPTPPNVGNGNMNCCKPKCTCSRCRR